MAKRTALSIRTSHCEIWTFPVIHRLAAPRLSLLPRPRRLLLPPFRPPLLLRHTDGPARCGGDDALGTRHVRTHDSQAGEIPQESLALDFDFVQACLRTGAGEGEKIGAGHRSSIQPGIEPPPIRAIGRPRPAASNHPQHSPGRTSAISSCRRRSHTPGESPTRRCGAAVPLRRRRDDGIRRRTSAR